MRKTTRNLTTIALTGAALIFASTAMAQTMAVTQKLDEERMSKAEFEHKKSSYASTCTNMCRKIKRAPYQLKTECLSSMPTHHAGYALCQYSVPTPNATIGARLIIDATENKWGEFVILDDTGLSSSGRKLAGGGRSPAACARMCLKDSSCKSAHLDGGMCYTKTRDETWSTQAARSSSYVILKTSFSEAHRYKLLDENKLRAVNLPGQDIKKLTGTSWDGCRMACASERRCDAITYVDGDDTCWLKQGAPKTKQTNKRGVTSSVIRKRASGGSGQRA